MEVRVENNRIIVITEQSVQYCDYSNKDKAERIAVAIRNENDPKHLSEFGKFIKV